MCVCACVYAPKVIPFPSSGQPDYFSVCVEDYSFIMQQIDLGGGGSLHKKRGKGIRFASVTGSLSDSLRGVGLQIDRSALFKKCACYLYLRDSH